jgi:DNA-binding transcriptional MerR regulator
VLEVLGCWQVVADLIQVEALSIGEAAARSGLSAHTLRYYERARLVEPIARGPRGERRYAARDLEWIAFLQRLRATGMPIREMRRFAELRTGGTATIPARRELLAAHHRRVLATIEDLRRNLAAIEAKLARLETGDGNAKE